MSSPAVPPVERTANPVHNFLIKGASPVLQLKIKRWVVHECPCQDSRPRVKGQFSYPDKEIFSVRIIKKYIPPLDPPNHHMVEGPRTIQSGLPWHGFGQSQFQESLNPYFDDFEQRPSFSHNNYKFFTGGFKNGAHCGDSHFRDHAAHDDISVLKCLFHEIYRFHSYLFKKAEFSETSDPQPRAPCSAP